MAIFSEGLDPAAIDSEKRQSSASMQRHKRRFAYEVPFSSGILELPFLKSAAGCLNLTLQRQQD
jgi:hypothetical protein